MSTDPRFIATIDLQEYFVDKDTGGPLSAGIVTFYKDVNRTIKKPVYQISGSPPSYTYTVLNNPLILSSVGTFQDENGADIIPYYFPYEGIPDDSSQTVELYYITVESALGVPQFTREAWPPNVGSGSDPISNAGYRNFIPNGQFWAHTDTPPVEVIAGQDVQFYAQGGFSFTRSTGGASVFNNSFTTFNGTVAGLSDLPRYAFNFECTSFNVSDQIRDIGWQWSDVNKFTTGDPLGSQPYTFFLAGKSNSASTFTFDVRLIRYYGTGGSPSATTDTSIGTINITPSYQYFTVLINGFPDEGGTIGTNNDDYVKIVLRGPTSAFSIQVTDFVLGLGNLAITAFPLQTNSDTLTRSVAGWMPQPNPDGSDLYLPLVLTSEGMTWQSSEVGQIKSTLNIKDFDGSLCTNDSYIICDGSAYIYADYSPLGVPYSRLGDVLWDEFELLPYTGTGVEYAMGFYDNGTPNVMRLVTNQAGPQTATADGTPATTFTFQTLYTGNTAYDQNAYVTDGLSEIFVYNTVQGSVTRPTAATAPVSIRFNQNNGVEEPPNAGINNFFYLVVSLVPSPGDYFTFSNTTTNYYVWFTVNGVGGDPAPGGTGILVPLLSTYTAEIVAQLIREAIAGYQGTLITFVAASLIAAGANFSFHAAGNEYVVYYTIGGAGTPPVSTGTLIEVALVGNETAPQVAMATTAAINRYQYAVPNLKGAILRGWDVGKDNIPGDLSASLRLNIPSQPFLQKIATYQWSQVLSHSHIYEESDTPTVLGTPVGLGVKAYLENTSSGLSDTSFPAINNSNANTTFYGSPETTPFNYAVNFIIKYQENFMTMRFSMTRDINGYNAFGVMPSDVINGTLLSQDAAQTLITLPSDAQQYVVLFSYSPGTNVFIDSTTTAAAYTGTPGAVTSELNPQVRQYAKGTVISAITPDTNGAYVQASVYALTD